MKILIKRVLWVFLFTISLAAMAAEPITGAFGFKLGEVPDSKSIIDKKLDYDGIPIYHVKPENPEAAFQKYELKMTPEDGRIYFIHGKGTYENMAAALKDMKAMLEKLEARYGPSRPVTETAVAMGSETRGVLLHAIEGSSKKGYLILQYTDRTLEKLAKYGKNSSKPGEIEGAFGFKFGDEFDVAKALGTVTTTAGDKLYRVKPPTPNPYFDVYYIAITPKTGRIYHVWAQGKVADDTEGKARQESLVKALEGKYKLRRGLMDSEDARILMQDDKLITLKSAVYPGGDQKLDLKYFDSTLEKEGKREASDPKAVPVDSKGL